MADATRNTLRHRVAPRRGSRTMAANHFVLNGSGVQVEYTIGANPSFTALTYKSGAVVKAFKPAQIQTDNTGLGEMVSVTLTTTLGTSERFGMFLLVTDVPFGQHIDFRTVGVYETVGGPDVVPPIWRCIEMQGTAETIAVPLVEPANA
jgi:hypothetical protein